MNKYLKKIWYSEFLISEDKKIVNKVLRYIGKEINKNHNERSTYLHLHSYLKEEQFPFIFLLDILKHHGKYFVITMNSYPGHNYDIRMSYYGKKFMEKGGYCIGYYMRNIFTLRFLFNKTKQYITI